METNNNTGQEPARFENRSGRVMGGVVLVVIGLLFLGHQAGLDIPYWIFSWEMLVIAIGLYVGARHSFRPGGWMIAILIGGIFLADDMLYDLDLRHYIWPSVIILIGLFMIFRPRRARGRFWEEAPADSNENAIDSVSIFGGTKKNIISKEFKGGYVTNIFGGTDINFMQADIQGNAMIDVTQVFGGIKLIVPAHWNIKSEIVCVFGGIDDKRPLTKDASDATKVLTLKGTCVFGGIDIKSY
jgi:predicted membrane protein